MRAGLIVTGVLGTGTALVFGAAALVSVAFPNGTTVAASWNNVVMWQKGGMMAPGGGIMMPVGGPVPMPAQEFVGPGTVTGGSGEAVPAPAAIESPAVSK